MSDTTAHVMTNVGEDICSKLRDDEQKMLEKLEKIKRQQHIMVRATQLRSQLRHVNVTGLMVAYGIAPSQNHALCQSYRAMVRGRRVTERLINALENVREHLIKQLHEEGQTH